MKRVWIVGVGVALMWTATEAFGSYRDLKKEFDDYSPPDMVDHRLVSETGAADIVVDNFEAAKAAIEDARKRWTGLLNERDASAAAVSKSLAVSAADDTQTLAMLRRPFSIETLEALILLRNPAIRGATARFRAALEGFDQVTQLDEVLRQYAAFSESVMTGVGPMTGMDDTIQMKFPFPGVAALKGQVAEKNVAAEKESMEIVRRETRAQGRKAYWNLLYTHRALQITRTTLDRLNHLESVATTRYGAGKTSYQDVVKIRIGREKLGEQLTTLKQQRGNLEAELLSLMDLPPGHTLGRPDTTAPDASLPPLDELIPLALERRQELKRMRAMVGKMERMVEMAETMIQPPFTQKASLYRNETIMQVGGTATKPTFTADASPARGKGLPKNAWFGTQDAFLRETRLKLDALMAELVDAEARTRLMVRTGWFDLDRALRERSLYRDRLLELSQTSLDVSTRGYESGNVSFADVIASYTGWLDVNLASQRRNSDVGIAMAELERKIGASLP